MSAKYDISQAIGKALAQYAADDVLSAITGHFVGLTVELCRRKGADVSLPIHIDGGAQRDITIHPGKRPAAKTRQP